MNEHNEKLFTLLSVLFMLFVWLVIILWLIAKPRTRPDYRAAFDRAFLEVQS